MPKNIVDADLYGPLVELDRLCDAMELLLDPGRKWYPEVESHLRRLDYAIRWEMDRLRWEVNFIEELKREAPQLVKTLRKKRAMATGDCRPVHLQEAAQQPYDERQPEADPADSI